MNELLASTLEFIDQIYPPSPKAIRMRRELQGAMDDLPNELSYLPFYAAQVSITITLLDNLTAAKSERDMRGDALRASVAFTIAIGMMNAALGISGEDTGVVN